MRLATQVGVPVRVSTILFEAVQFAWAVAEATEGAFDPTVGYAMESLGFNREYRTGQTIRTPLDSNSAVSYRDVRLDAERQTITLLRPLILDLGAVAKGAGSRSCGTRASIVQKFRDQRGWRSLSRRIQSHRRTMVDRNSPSAKRWGIDRFGPGLKPRRLHFRRLRKTSCRRRARPSHSRSAHRIVSERCSKRDGYRTYSHAGRCACNGRFRSGSV